MKASQPSQPASAEAQQAHATDLIAKLAEDLKPLAEDLKPMVDAIEQSVPTTKEHYDRYMNVLSQFPRGYLRDAVVLALIQAGANKGGVLWARKLIE